MRARARAHRNAAHEQFQLAVFGELMKSPFHHCPALHQAV